MRTYTIADAAQKAGLSVHQVRIYLEMGLVRPCGATSGGYRLFDATCIERLRLIKACRDAELSLAEIAAVFRQVSSDELTQGRTATQLLRTRIKEKQRALSRCARMLETVNCGRRASATGEAE